MDHAIPSAKAERPDLTATKLEADYQALRVGAGVRLSRERAVIRVSGDDRVSFLHGMCSNEIRGLGAGSVVAALFLTERAHLIAEANVWVLPDALLLEMERGLWPAVRGQLERFLVADDVEFEEIPDGAGLGAVVQVDGPGAATVVASVLGDVTDNAAAAPGPWRFTAAEDGVLIAHVARWNRPACTILARRDDAAGIAARLAALGVERGDIREVSVEAAEILRVESGTARVGVDTNDKTIALEARMEAAISFSKGCYVGQETIERATARGSLKRRLMGIRIAGQTVPAAGRRVTLANKEVGNFTSPLHSPRLGAIGLALLHHSAWAPGTEVLIDDENAGLRAAVSELPFPDENRA